MRPIFRVCTPATEIERLRENFDRALRVMLALRRSARQVIVAYEELSGIDMVGELLVRLDNFLYRVSSYESALAADIRVASWEQKHVE